MTRRMTEDYEDYSSREKISPIAAMLKSHHGRHVEEDSRHYWSRDKFKRAKSKKQRPSYKTKEIRDGK